MHTAAIAVAAAPIPGGLPMLDCIFKEVLFAAIAQTIHRQVHSTELRL
jgi:hypothetical protein